jgi:hypothetical protein
VSGLAWHSPGIRDSMTRPRVTDNCVGPGTGERKRVSPAVLPAGAKDRENHRAAAEFYLTIQDQFAILKQIGYLPESVYAA